MYFICVLMSFAIILEHCIKSVYHDKINIPSKSLSDFIIIQVLKVIKISPFYKSL